MDPERETDMPAGSDHPKSRRTTLKQKVAELEKRIAELESELEETRDKLLRAYAETQTLTRRLDEERERGRKAGREELALKLADFIEQVIAALAYAETAASSEAARDGFRMLQTDLLTRLESAGIALIDPSGEQFDHRFHHAIGVVDTNDHDEGTIVEVVRKGLRVGDTVVKPSLVRVARRPAESEHTEGSENTKSE
jgi:molecular chaperone GrpE